MANGKATRPGPNPSRTEKALGHNAPAHPRRFRRARQTGAYNRILNRVADDANQSPPPGIAARSRHHRAVQGTHEQVRVQVRVAPPQAARRYARIAAPLLGRRTADTRPCASYHHRRQSEQYPSWQRRRQHGARAWAKCLADRHKTETVGFQVRFLRTASWPREGAAPAPRGPSPAPLH